MLYFGTLVRSSLPRVRPCEPTRLIPNYGFALIGSGKGLILSRMQGRDRGRKKQAEEGDNSAAAGPRPRPVKQESPGRCDSLDIGPIAREGNNTEMLSWCKAPRRCAAPRCLRIGLSILPSPSRARAPRPSSVYLFFSFAYLCASVSPSACCRSVAVASTAALSSPDSVVSSIAAVGLRPSDVVKTAPHSRALPLSYSSLHLLCGFGSLPLFPTAISFLSLSRHASL